MSKKQNSALTLAVIAFLVYAIIFNFLLLPRIILYKQMEFSESSCSNFCSGIAKAAAYTTEYNRNTKSLGCICRNTEGTVLIKTFYPIE